MIISYLIYIKMMFSGYLVDIICDIPPAQNGSGFPEWLKYAYPRFLFIDVSNILINMFGNLAW